MSIFKMRELSKLLFSVIRYIYIYAQSRNGYNSGIVPAQSRNSHFGGRSKNSYLARFNSGIVPAQSRNRDKVRIYYFPAQSRNRGQSKNIYVIIITILFCENYNRCLSVNWMRLINILDEN